MSEPRPLLVLRALAAKGPLSTPDIRDALELWTDPPQRALSWLGTILRVQRQDGLVVRVGQTVGHWQQSPAVIWEITDQGLGELRRIDSIREWQQQEALRLAAAAEERRLALTAAAKIARRDMSRLHRREIALRLRNAGCTLEEIGALFGVTREMIRQDTAPDFVPPAPKVKQPRRYPALIAVGLVENLVRLEIGKRVIYLTKDEAIRIGSAAQAGAS